MAELTPTRPGAEEQSTVEALRAAKEYAESIVETIHEPLLVLTPDLRVKSANPAFYQDFQVRPQETLGRRIYELGNGQWDIPAYSDASRPLIPEQVDHRFRSKPTTGSDDIDHPFR